MKIKNVIIFFLILFLTISSGLIYKVYCRYSDSISNTLSISIRKPNYTVVFNKNNPNGVTISGTMNNQNFVYGTPQNLSSNNYSSSGLTFLHWNTKPDDSGTVYTNGQSIDGLTVTDGTDGYIVNLYAIWQVNNCTVSFNLNLGPGNASPITVTYNQPYGTLPTPVKTGYSFAGWYKEDNFINEVTASTLVATAGNHTLYAKWEPITYTIRFNSNGGNGTMPNLVMTYGTAKELSRNIFTRTGYGFTGWNTASDGSGTSYIDMKSVNNLTTTNNQIIDLYAQWSTTAVARIGSTFYTSLANAFNAVPTTNTETKIYLLQNRSENITISSSNKNVLLDLSGYTLSNNGNSGRIFYFYGSIKVVNGTLNGSYSSSATASLILLRSGANFELGSDVSITNNSTVSTVYLNSNTSATISGSITGVATKEDGVVVVSSNATLNVTDGAHILNNSSSTSAKYAIYNNGVMSISGGTIESVTSTALYNDNTSSSSFTNGVITMTDGFIKSTNGYALYNYRRGTATISGGTIESINSDALRNITSSRAYITGGTFTTNSSSRYAIYNSATLTISGANVNGNTHGV